MPSQLDPARFQAAQGRFVAFFRELAGIFMEREDVLMQIALALLSREHVLLTGPPGTAKSLLASSVLGRLIDEETGGPSVYARQFTESTVQTDLIGPINFKTLTETGRTEHFTDEGMLGAVHAFLDEVFDGRDMLLRSTLNLLQERELKQGTRVTRGRFECAVMASNRYIADVIEGARETLLAFVDRIAFVGFVPRAFADTRNLREVLRGQVGGVGRKSLEAPLSIQDLDALQQAVDAVYISDPICEGLAALLDRLDAELHAAERADPTFVPTRYLSTRTAVRSGRILRAICVYEKLFHDPERALEVMPQDLLGLRLHLLLSGPPPEAVGQLLERETDPRERRQLSIVRTEREIFDRVWSKLPPIKVTPRPVAPAAVAAAGAASASPCLPFANSTGVGAQPGSPGAGSSAVVEGGGSATPAPTPLEARAMSALESRDVKRILEAVRELIPVAKGAGDHADRPSALLKASVAALHAQAIRAHLASGVEEKQSLFDVVGEMALLADTLEGGAGSMRPLALWLRGRALVLIGDAVGYSLGLPALDLVATQASIAARPPMAQAEHRIESLEALSAQRRQLLAKGIEPSGRKEAEDAWARGLLAAEDEAVLLCDASLQLAAAQRREVAGAADLARVLSDLAPDFERVARLEQRIEALRGDPSMLKARSIGPRIGLVIEASFARLGAVDRSAIGGSVEAMLAVLQRAGLASVIAPDAWVTWTAEALARSEEVDRAEDDAAVPLSYEGYRGLRGRSPRVLCAFVLAEVALRVAPEIAASGSATGEGLSAVADLLMRVPDETRARVTRLDLARLTRAVGYLERWWELLSGRSIVSSGSADAALQELVRSRFFDVLLDESALVRFVLEARLLAEIFPDSKAEAAAVRGRVDSLQERARRRAFDLVRARADAAWTGTLGLVAPSAGAGALT